MGNGIVQKFDTYIQPDTPNSGEPSNPHSIELVSGTGVLPTPIRPLTPSLALADKEADSMVSAAAGIASPETRKGICIGYLAMSRVEMERASANRMHYVHLARKYGLTNAEIGNALGVSEAAVRGLIARAS